MKAIRIQTYGDADCMKMEDAPMPVCAANGLLVRVVAAGVNPVDWKIRSGAMAHQLPKTFPITLGQDAAGTVVEVGSAASDFKVGDEVFFYADFMHGGTYAEYVAVEATQVALKPHTVPFAAAAALPKLWVRTTSSTTARIALKISLKTWTSCSIPSAAPPKRPLGGS